MKGKRIEGIKVEFRQNLKLYMILYYKYYICLVFGGEKYNFENRGGGGGKNMILDTAQYV